MSAIIENSFKAWSCQCSVEFIEPQFDPETSTDAIKATLKKYEDQFSRFKATSTLAKLNQGKIIERSQCFDEILDVAIKLQEQINHPSFNLHVDLTTEGYDRSFEKGPTNNVSPDKNIPQFPRGLTLTSDTMQLAPELKLDFGSFLKGYLAQKLADHYAPQCRGLIINLGGDLTVRGFDTHSPKFAIGIFNPVTHFDESILLQNQSLSTSGTYKRKWTQNGESKHHIVNPSNQRSCVSDFVSISFWGPDGALCDALSTAAFNSCPSTWNTWRKSLKDINYLAIEKNGAITSSFKKSQ